MQAESASGFDWRDSASYAPLLGADRSLFAWEWLRRDPRYRAAAERASAARSDVRREDPAAAPFGLVAFEAPDFGVPYARPLWQAGVHPQVLAAERGRGERVEELFSLDRLRDVATVVEGERSDHLLLSDGLRAIRLDGPPGLFGGPPACLRYRLEGLASAGPQVLTLRRFLALTRTGSFSRSLHQRESRARRWILMLRAWDALSCGAGQRLIAEILLSRSAEGTRWRSREPSIRSQAQRLVGSARSFGAGGYMALLAHHCRLDGSSEAG